MKINTALWPWIIAATIAAVAMYSISNIFLPFIMGLFIAYTMHPMVTKMGQWGIGRSLSTLTLLIGFFLLIGSTLFVLIPFIIRELVVLAGALPEYSNRLFEAMAPHMEILSDYIGAVNFSELQAKASSYTENIFSWGLKFMASLLTNALAIANLITLIVITPVVAFYMLRDWPALLEQIKRLLPHQQAPTIIALAQKINDTLGGYVRGQSVVCLILAIMYSLGLWLVGLDYAVTIGFITGLFSFIPFVGMLIGVLAGMGVALSQFDTWLPIVMVGVVFGVGNLIEGQLLSPNLIGGRIGLHPVWIIFALLAGGSLLGFIGMLLALPTAAIIGVLVRYSVDQYLQSSLYYGEPVKRPKAKEKKT